jgi:hypothetical protein
MAKVMDFRTGAEMLHLTEEEEEFLRWEPFAIALYEAIRREQKKFGADDMILIEVLESLMDGFLSDLEGELNEEDGGHDAA